MGKCTVDVWKARWLGWMLPVQPVTAAGASMFGEDTDAATQGLGGLCVWQEIFNETLRRERETDEADSDGEGDDVDGGCIKGRRVFL